eukprot:294477-Rhodomonas_salina.2
MSCTWFLLFSVPLSLHVQVPFVLELDCARARHYRNLPQKGFRASDRSNAGRVGTTCIGQDPMARTRLACLAWRYAFCFEPSFALDPHSLRAMLRVRCSLTCTARSVGRMDICSACLAPRPSESARGFCYSQTEARYSHTLFCYQAEFSGPMWGLGHQSFNLLPGQLQRLPTRVLGNARY